MPSVNNILPLSTSAQRLLQKVHKTSCAQYMYKHGFITPQTFVQPAADVSLAPSSKPHCLTGPASSQRDYHGKIPPLYLKNLPVSLAVSLSYSSTCSLAVSSGLISGFTLSTISWGLSPISVSTTPGSRLIIVKPSSAVSCHDDSFCIEDRCRDMQFAEQKTDQALRHVYGSRCAAPTAKLWLW